MTARHLIATAAVFGLMAALPVSGAFAADSSDTSSTQSTSGSDSTHFTDKQLKEFVAAQNNVQDTLTKWQDKLSNAKSDDKKKSLEQQENKALVKAVKDSGLDPKTYNAIAKQAPQDKKLTQRIQSFMTPQ